MKPCRFLIVLFLVPAASLSSFAQVVLPDKEIPAGLRENVFGLGLFGGPATGLGLSFRHHLPSSLSYQVTGGIIRVENRTSYDIGGEAQVDLSRTPTSRFFAGGGAGYYYSGTSGNNGMKAPARIALGLGGEFAVSPGLHTEIEAYFTFFSDGTVLPLPQIGFHYYFY
jgi:hypothetical protein